jgi:hypothetical protein
MFPLWRRLLLLALAAIAGAITPGRAVPDIRAHHPGAAVLSQEQPSSKLRCAAPDNGSQLDLAGDERFDPAPVQAALIEPEYSSGIDFSESSFSHALIATASRQTRAPPSNS